MEALSPDLALIGLSLDANTCLKCIHRLKIIDPAMPILTCCDDRCISGGADSAPFEGIYYLNPAFELDELSKAMEGALQRKAECLMRPDSPIIIGRSRGITSIREKIQNVADKDITVLITGETGTGKELIARSLHYHSHRHAEPLVKINCGALPDELLESEVFGFQKGAFTGAIKNKPGRLELADGGTLFIDEIGDLSLSLQVKFLQILEDKAFSRLGGTQDKVVDARVVAATNSDLSKKVREGSFRKDLFYRLNVVQIEAPALRNRKNDILLLVDYFINKYCYEFKKEPIDVPDKVANILMGYQWPGNIRELENVIRRAIVLRDWDFIFKDLNLENVRSEKEPPPFSDDDLAILDWHEDKIMRFFRENDFSLKKISKAYVAEAECIAIIKALKGTQWNRRRAARLLGVSYKTLLNRITEFDLHP
jgi:transcriptional regulator with PAS, ATPase and Fis domain